MSVRAFATGRVKLDKQGRVTVSGNLIRWDGLAAEPEPFRFCDVTDYRPRGRRKDYSVRQGSGRVIDLDVLKLCVHLRPWTSPCTDCGRGRG